MPGLPDRQWRIACWGAFFLLLGVYLFSHPGRIDMIDGQYRFDVSRNLINLNGPCVSDYWLVQAPLPTNPKTGNFYSYYTAPASFFPLPLMIASRALLGVKAASDRFSFSLASAFAGAMLAPLLLAFYRRLGVALKPALGWTAVFCLATLWWPGAETVFDQVQHGIVLMAMLLAAYDVAKGGAWGLALVTGLLGGVLFNYRIPFLALLPAFPIYWIVEARRSKAESGQSPKGLRPNIAAYCVGVGIGLAGYALYNWVRFGSTSMPHYVNGVTMVGNPVAGFLTLTISPGKGLLWYSPPLLLAAFGLAGFWRKDRGLAGLVIALSIVHLCEMSSLSFAGGDWCWGPRYLIPIMPLWALAFPYIVYRVLKPWIVSSIVGLGFAVQLLGLSVDHHRFFYYRRLPALFWMNEWSYFRFSQLAARPAEVIESIAEWNWRRPMINSGPMGEATYCPFGPPRRPAKAAGTQKPTPGKAKVTVRSITSNGAAALIKKAADKQTRRPIPPPPDPRVWVQRYRIFYDPRPWWGWINDVPLDQRPVDPMAFFLFCTVTTCLGAGLLGAGLKGVRKSSQDPAEYSPNEPPEAPEAARP